LFSVHMVGESWILFPDAESLSISTFNLEDLASGRNE
jgi:hypothetical protein